MNSVPARFSSSHEVRFPELTGMLDWVRPIEVVDRDYYPIPVEVPTRVSETREEWEMRRFWRPPEST
jgi:hypothetical protein